MGRTETVTVVFTDLVGSTGLASRVGPTAAEELRREHFAVLRDAIAESDGTEVKNLGDGLMVVFASASAGVGCAVAMQQRMERRNRRAEEQLGIRIGISLGDADRDEDDYFGPPVIEAARLCAKAGGGQILAGEMARMMAGGRGKHEFRSIGTLELKGIPEAYPTFEVAWKPLGEEAALPLPARLREMPPVGYVGRSTEREALTGLYEEASAGSLRVALISGEPGIGKTRLSTYVALEAHATGATVLYGRCDEDLGLPYQPWVEAVRHCVEHASDDVLAAHVEEHGGELARIAPALARRADGLSEPRASDPETERYLLYGAVVGLLEQASAEEPIVLILDDLHWADKPTLSLLKHLVGSGSGMSTMILGTFRDSDLGRDHPLTDTLADLRRQTGVTRLSLTGLVETDVVDLMQAAAGHELDRDGRGLAHEIASDTGGNPFFVAELLRHLVETNAIAQGDDGRWRLGGSLAELGLPESVREVIARRVGALGDRCRRVLSAAAVIGRDFDVDLLEAIVDVDEDELLDVLEEAAGASLLTESGDASGRFTFAHALINHTLYDDLSRTRRARVHRRIAEALEDLCGADPGARVAELANHWSLAVQPVETSKALEYARRAGERALAELAPDEGLRWFERALELLDGRAAPDDELRCDLLTGLGEAQRQTGDFDFRQTLLEACAIADRLGEPDRLARAALANSRGFVSAFGFVDDERVAVLRRALELDTRSDSPQRARLMALLAMELHYDRDHEARRRLADDALELARASGDRRTLALVLRDHFSAFWAVDTVERRQDTTTELLALADELGDPLLRAQAAVLAFNVAAERCAGDEADRHLERARELADRLGQPGIRWYAHYFTAGFAQLRGRVAEGRAASEKAAEIGSDGGQPDALVIYAGQSSALAGQVGSYDEILDVVEQSVEDNPELPAFSSGLGYMYAMLGREADARRILDEARAAGFDSLGLEPTRCTSLSYYSHIAALVGDADAAAELYPLLVPLSGLACWAGAIGWGTVDHALGLCAATQGDHERAIEHYAAAAEIERRVDMQYFLAWTHLSWARSLLALDGDDRERRARGLIEDAIARSREHGYPRCLADAEAVLAAREPA